MNKKIVEKALEAWDEYNSFVNFKPTNENFDIIKAAFIKGYIWKCAQLEIEKFPM